MNDSNIVQNSEIALVDMEISKIGVVNNEKQVLAINLYEGKENYHQDWNHERQLKESDIIKTEKANKQINIAGDSIDYRYPKQVQLILLKKNERIVGYQIKEGKDEKTGQKTIAQISFSLLSRIGNDE